MLLSSFSHHALVTPLSSHILLLSSLTSLFLKLSAILSSQETPTEEHSTTLATSSSSPKQQLQLHKSHQNVLQPHHTAFHHPPPHQRQQQITQPPSTPPKAKQTAQAIEHEKAIEHAQNALKDWTTLHARFGDAWKVAEDKRFKAFSPGAVGKVGEDGKWTRKRTWEEL